MGAVVSIFDPPPVDDPALGNRDRPYFEYFGMTKFDVAPLLQQYNKMSKTKEKKVRVKTIIRRYGVRNAFMNKFFSMMCEKKLKDKPSVDYKTFIYLVWNFLSIGLNLVPLVMSLYDLRRTKRLTKEDLYDMMKDVHGWKLEQRHTELTKAIRNIEEEKLTLQQFQGFVLKNKLALEPVQKAMEKMQEKTLGKSRWTQLALKRQNKWEGNFVDIYDTLANMKEETGCPDDIITLEQYVGAIDKNQQYLQKLEDAKAEKAREKAEAQAKKEEEKKKKKMMKGIYT